MSCMLCGDRDKHKGGAVIGEASGVKIKRQGRISNSLHCLSVTFSNPKFKHPVHTKDQRYEGDFVSHAKCWPKFKRMETTKPGIEFWSKVRYIVEMEFDRKKISKMGQARRGIRQVTWSKSVEDIQELKLRVSSANLVDEINERIPFSSISDEVEEYRYRNSIS